MSLGRKGQLMCLGAGSQVDTYTGAFCAAEALALAWTFSAGSLVAGFPGVE